MSLTNKQKARAYHTAVSEYDVATVASMIQEDYIQHNPRVPTGAAAFLALFPILQKHGTKIQNQRIFQDGDHVIMHHLWKNAAPFGADEKIAFHILRFASDGLIAEHWSVMTDVAPANSFGLSQIDGPREIENLGDTDRNKAKVAEMFRLLTAAKAEDYEKIYSLFFLPAYHQHHPEGIDGQSGLVYECQHKVFGSGNFVLSICEGKLRGKPMALYDLFRLQGGMIAEHWSIYQEIPPTPHANENGMFGF